MNQPRSRLQNAIALTIKTVDQDGKNVYNQTYQIFFPKIALKAARLWQKDDFREQNIKIQRLIHVLKLLPLQRTQHQLSLMQAHFEQSYLYIQKIKDKLDLESYLSLYRYMKFERCDKHEIVFNEGETGRKMYFILEGEVAILIPINYESVKPDLHSPSKIPTFEDFIRLTFPQFKLIAVKKGNEYFGEIALEQRIPRTATVVTKSACSFGILTYDSYQKVLGQYQEQVQKEKMQFIQSIPMFNEWQRQGQLVLLHSCEEINIPTKSFIYKRNKIANHVYLVVQGEIIVEKWESSRTRTGQSLEQLDENLARIARLSYDRQVTLGVMRDGSIFCDYELYLDGLEQTSYKRLFSTHSQLVQFLVNKYKSKDSQQVQGFLAVPVQQANTLNHFNLATQYFKKEKNELNDMFLKKFSYAIPFRNDPLNRQEELITTKSIKLKTVNEKSLDEEQQQIAGIQNILYPDKFKKPFFPSRRIYHKSTQSSELIINDMRKKAQSRTKSQPSLLMQTKNKVFQFKLTIFKYQQSADLSYQTQEPIRPKTQQVQYKFQMQRQPYLF